MSEYEAALFIHLLGVTALAAGLGVAAASFELARTRSQAVEIAVLLGIARVGVALVAGGSLAVVGGGAWLIEAGPFSFRDAWLATSMGLFVLGTVLGAAGGRRPKRARLRAERLARDGAPADTELRRLLSDPLARVLNYTAVTVMVAVLALMVAKP